MTTLEAARWTDERWAWVALALVRPIVGRARAYHDLLGRLDSATEVFHASHQDLAGVVGDEAAAALRAFDWRRAARE
ncbi:MAG: hypothetical protein ACREJR_10560 [Candidatus Rokuibacteriota bacterium]